MKYFFNSYFVLIISTVMMIIFPMFNTGNSNGNSQSFTQQDQIYPSVFELNKTDKLWIEKTLSEMSLYQKCAQMIMIPVYRSYMDTTSPDYADVVNLVRNRKVGGLIMFQGELKQEIEFIKSMQQLASIPLLVASDFERGLGSRIDDALEFPHHMSLGATLNAQYAYAMAKAIAEESRLIGVHQNLAPVADINNNSLNPVINVRSFSESKYTTANFVSSFVLGTKHGKVLSTAKHFPGHGNTEIDSHTELPMINGEKKYLLENELYPFIEAIKAGVHSIMVGHLEVPAYDSLPASLSKKVVTDLLINTLGFDGLIVTDALNMEGITKYYSLEEMVLLAVNAGNDIILMPPDPPIAISAIYKTVLEEKISEERINTSVRKILAAKRWLGIYKEQDEPVETIINKINNNDHLKLAEEIAAASITLIKNDKGIIPLDPDSYNNISCVTVTDGEGDETAAYFQNILNGRIGNVDTLLLTANSVGSEYTEVYNVVKNSDLILLPLFLEVEPENKSEKLVEKQRDFINKLLKLRAPIVVISFRNPYPTFSQKNVKTYLNVYSYAKVSQSAALKAILGETNISGKLPISIPNSEYEIGYGLTIDKTITTKLSYDFNSGYKFEKLDTIILKSINKSNISSAEICIGIDGVLVYQKSYGTGSSESKKKKSGRINLGSLTAPLALTTAIMMLVDEEKLSVSDKVSQYLYGFDSHRKENITIKSLLLHNSGIGKSLGSINTNWTKQDLLNGLNDLTLTYTTGEQTIYSELNLILLQFIIEKLTGEPLNHFLEENLYKPIGMKSTSFSISDTNEKITFSNGLLTFISYKSQQDILNHIMAGVTGYNNLYSDVNDLAIFAQMMIQEGYYSGKQYISANTVDNFTSIQLPESYSALGWNTIISETNVYKKLPDNTYGYNSDSGSSLWIDSDNKIFIIFLSESNSDLIEELIPQIQQAAYQELTGK